MVLLRGIEPPTPSLPRTCSTPELQQHFHLFEGRFWRPRRRGALSATAISPLQAVLHRLTECFHFLTIHRPFHQENDRCRISRKPRKPPNRSARNVPPPRCAPICAGARNSSRNAATKSPPNRPAMASDIAPIDLLQAVKHHILGERPYVRHVR